MNSIGFKILQVKIAQFAFFEEHYESSNEEFALNTNIELKINNDKHQIGLFLTIQFFQNDKLLIKSETGNHFVIEENKWNEFKIENKIIIPKDFISHLAMISIGSMRGVLVAKTENTSLSKLILPTLNVQKMFQKDVEFILDNQ
jgi:hypothetical protein